MADVPESCCFDDWARSELRRARRRKRLDGVTRALLDAIDGAELDDRTVLEVGCGAGELTLACVEHGARRATGMDLGPGAVEAARTLAREKGLADRTTFLAADGSSEPLQTHDVVVLNRVICCFPDAGGLVEHTASAAGDIYAFVMPRSSGPAGVLNRAQVMVENLMFRLRRAKFGGYQAFVHDVGDIEARLAAAGFAPVHRQSVRYVWHLAVHQRRA